MGSPHKKEPKKRYEPPSLTVFGKIEELTQAVAPLHHRDGGSQFPRTGTGVR
jgi:hypothetical protein